VSLVQAALPVHKAGSSSSNRVLQQLHQLQLQQQLPDQVQQYCQHLLLLLLLLVHQLFAVQFPPLLTPALTQHPSKYGWTTAAAAALWVALQQQLQQQASAGHRQNLQLQHTVELLLPLLLLPPAIVSHSPIPVMPDKRAASGLQAGISSSSSRGLQVVVASTMVVVVVVAVSAMLLRMAATRMLLVLMGGAVWEVMLLSMNWRCWLLCQVSSRCEEVKFMCEVGRKACA
jgi:hypothetical protein